MNVSSWNIAESIWRFPHKPMHRATEKVNITFKQPSLNGTWHVRGIYTILCLWGGNILSWHAHPFHYSHKHQRGSYLVHPSFVFPRHLFHTEPEPSLIPLSHLSTTCSPSDQPQLSYWCLFVVRSHEWCTSSTCNLHENHTHAQPFAMPFPNIFRMSIITTN